MKQAVLAVSLALVLTGCGRKEENGEFVARKDRTASSETDTPAINSAATPGVSFEYNYGFSLPDKKIARVQELHADQCAKLGVAKCRISALNFSKMRGGPTLGSLTVRLDPSIALAFAREASVIVEKEGGKLETSEVSGEDAGSQVAKLTRGASEIAAELGRVAAQLKTKELSDRAKSELVARETALREELRGLTAERGEKQEQIATAPMTFTYEVGETILGFDRQSTVGSSLLTGKESMSMMLAFAALVGPWLLLAFGAYWLWKRFWPARRQGDSSE